MNENKMDLLEGIELTDNVLEDINGGFELSTMHKGAIANFVAKKKAENWTLEQVINYLQTNSAFMHNPAHLEAAVAYARQVW